MPQNSPTRLVFKFAGFIHNTEWTSATGSTSDYEGCWGENCLDSVFFGINYGKDVKSGTAHFATDNESWTSMGGKLSSVITTFGWGQNRTVVTTSISSS